MEIEKELRLACLTLAVEIYKLKAHLSDDVFVIAGDIYTFVTTGDIEWSIPNETSETTKMKFSEIVEKYILSVRKGINS